jgi:hypothetical protein
MVFEVYGHFLFTWGMGPPCTVMMTYIPFRSNLTSETRIYIIYYKELYVMAGKEKKMHIKRENISVLAKVTQVRDVAHGSLVLVELPIGTQSNLVTHVQILKT